jgi:hypothetical protein
MISNPGRVSPAAFSAVHLLFHLKMRIIINFRNLGPRQGQEKADPRPPSFGAHCLQRLSDRGSMDPQPTP